MVGDCVEHPCKYIVSSVSEHVLLSIIDAGRRGGGLGGGGTGGGGDCTVQNGGGGVLSFAHTNAAPVGAGLFVAWLT
jgi:hypothetical protein